MAEPLGAEALFICCAQLCVALSGVRSDEQKTEVFKEALNRMLIAWLEDRVAGELEEDGNNTATHIGAGRKSRRKEVDESDERIRRLIVIAQQKLGL
jgi:hypothetical protein